ncbi:MAG TPA: serine acetyltransferase [Burkholderiales bacterium]|nr:serine acetyltransferase [Burkholderiales bacterium]
MEERGYVAEALLERLRAAGIVFRLMGEPSAIAERAPEEMELAVPPAALGELPAVMARFAQELDLHLVELYRPGWAAWRVVLAWSNEIGHPRFMAVRFFVGAEEGITPDALFACGLLDAIEKRALSEVRAAWLSGLWQQDPHAAMERVATRWRKEQDRRLVANAARSGNWQAVRGHLKDLRGFRLPRAPRRAPRVLFTGRDSPQRTDLMIRVQGRLAPLGLDIFEHLAGVGRRADFRVVFDGPPGLEQADAVAVRADQPLPERVVETERAILRWLEQRVERRYPDAVVGANPLAARLLQMPLIGQLLGVVLNSRLDCRIGSPLLMPVPYGIVIERGVSIGSRVTVMHQVTIGRKDPVVPKEHGGNLAVIEDNVFIGAGAKVLGPVRIGRGATVGANAVVTRDVPSHCTVVGANRILGIGDTAVAAGRRHESDTVVNM